MSAPREPETEWFMLLCVIACSGALFGALLAWTEFEKMRAWS